MNVHIHCIFIGTGASVSHHNFQSCTSNGSQREHISRKMSTIIDLATNYTTDRPNTNEQQSESHANDGLSEVIDLGDGKFFFFSLQLLKTYFINIF